MKIPFSPPDISQEEIDEVVDTLKSGWITTGPKTKKLEKEITEYINTDGTICLNSATAAMETALRLLGIGKGDEVITSAYTYTASASVIKHVGAKIVLVDTIKDSFMMDLDKLNSAITENTKAIIPVDIAGVPADYDGIKKIINNNVDKFKPNSDIQKLLGKIAIVADNAHSLGSIYKGRKTGEDADFSNFSFHAVKNFTTGEGGALSWKSINGISNEEIYRRLQLLTLHGQNKDALSKTKLGSWEYDIIDLNYKFNMPDITAAIGLAQFRRYPELLKRRKEIINYYDNSFEKTPIKVLKHSGNDFESNGHLYLTRVNGISLEERNSIIEKLAEKGIAANVHYKPLPLLTGYKNIGFKIEDFPNAYNQYINEITLPLHTLLTDEEVVYIVNSYKEIVNEFTK